MRFAPLDGPSIRPWGSGSPAPAVPGPRGPGRTELGGVVTAVG